MLSPTVSFVAVMGLGAPELIIILVQSIKEFKKSSRDDVEPEVVKPVEVKKPEATARTHGSN
jgi:hypothetical protein